MKTYYTKCGRQFEKSSTALVTGYLIPEGDKQCEECPFRVEVKEGWPPVFKRWECRAGSLPPNQENSWRGSLKDKNTIHIDSLHNDFLEAVLEYCRKDEDLTAAFNQDLDDCRRTISVSCSGNKKGIAAKKQLIEKFFPLGDCIPEEQGEKCGTCDHYKPDEGHDITGKCPETMRIIHEEQLACRKHKPKICTTCENDDTGCVPNVPEAEMCAAHVPKLTPKRYIDDKNRLIFVSTGLGGDNYMTMYRDQGWLDENQGMHRLKSQSLPVRGTPEEAQADLDAYATKKGWEVYVEESKEDDTVKCTKHRCPFNNDEISQCGFNPITDDAHRPQMQEARDEYQCTNSELLDVLSKIESREKKCEGCCYLHKSDICNNTNNQRRATPETPRCGWYWNVKTGEMGSEQHKESYPDGEYEYLESKVEMELVKPEDRYIEESTKAPVAAFDYSTVDNDTATFLQEKEQKITQIRMLSTMAIGKELKEVHEKLANHYQGSFGKWCDSVGFTDRTARNYINALDYVRKNFPNIEAAENIQQSLLFAVSKPSAPAELQKAVIDGDITTHKQYKELEDKLKAEKERADSAELREKAREKEKAWEEKKAMDNYKAAQEAQKRAEQAEKALIQSRDEHKSKNDRHDKEVVSLRQRIAELNNELATSKETGGSADVEDLQKQLAEAQRQVDILTDELMKPIELAPAVVEKVPEEIEKELEELRKKTGLEQDYMFVSDILGMFRIAHPSRLKGWAKVIVKENAEAKVKEIRNELINLGTTIESMIDYLDEEVQMK